MRKQIKSDMIRLKSTRFWLIHLLAPLCMVLVFLGYYSFAGWSQENQIIGYFTVIGIALPVMIALLCIIVTDQELEAGSYQQMLTASNRWTAFFSKLILLSLSGAASVLMTCFLFGLGNYYLLGHNIVNMKFYLVACGSFLSEVVVLYTIHLFLSFVFHNGVTIMLGLVEGLLSALLRTGLGDGKWQCFPCEWGTRFMHNYFLYFVHGKEMEPKCSQAVVICILMSFTSLILFGLWCKHWEGTHSEE